MRSSALRHPPAKHRRTRPDGSTFTTPPHGARRAVNRRRTVIAKQSRKGNR